MTEPEDKIQLDQVEEFEFKANFGDASWPTLLVDEAAPVGTGEGPGPAQVLCVAVGHCLSSTLLYTLHRARVPVRPISTTVRATIGKNPRGRNRVLSLSVSIETAPLDEADRTRFDHCVATFEDFCTVSGSVREGVPIVVQITPSPDQPELT